MRILKNIIIYHILTVVLASLLLSCGDGSEILPPKTDLDPTDQTIDETNPSSSNDSTGSVSDTDTAATSTKTQKNSKNKVNPNIVSSDEETDLQSDSTQITSTPKKEKKTENLSNTRSKIVQEEKNGTSSQYNRPFISSPYPSDYRERIDNSGTLNDQLRPFASEIANTMKMAKQNISKAREAFEKLKTCALAKPTDEIFAVRASCAENLKTLTKLYPNDFSEEYAEIEKKFPKDIKDSLIF